MSTEIGGRRGLPLRVGYVMQNNAADLTVPSGPQLHVAAVVNGLRAEGHVVRTLTIQQGAVRWSDDLVEWAPAGFGVSRAPWFRAIERPVRRLQHALGLPFACFFDSVRFADAAIRHLRGYDLMYERYGFMGYGGVLAARRLGVPSVIELNGNILEEMDEIGVAMTPAQRAIGRFVTARTLRAADHVVVVAEALKQTVVHELGVDERNVSVVRNGVDLALFQQPVDPAAVRTRYGLGDAHVVTFVGSFQPWHGVDLLVRAFEIVVAGFPDAQLVLVGEGPGRDQVEAQVAASGLSARVRLLGRLAQPEVAAITRISDVLVAPYPFDRDHIVGTPLKLLEYMASERAIVASTASIHEIIRDGVTGLRVQRASPEALAAGIGRLLAEPALRQALGQAAGREARTHSWDRVVGELVSLFRRLVDLEAGQRQPAGRVSTESSTSR